MTPRRRFLAFGVATAGAMVLPEVSVLAQQAQAFIQGPPVADIAPIRLSERVWYICLLYTSPEPTRH